MWDGSITELANFWFVWHKWNQPGRAQGAPVAHFYLCYIEIKEVQLYAMPIRQLLPTDNDWSNREPISVWWHCDAYNSINTMVQYTDQRENIIQMVQYSYITTSIHQLYIVQWFFFSSFLLYFPEVLGIRLAQHYIIAARWEGGLYNIEGMWVE